MEKHNMETEKIPPEVTTADEEALEENFSIALTASRSALMDGYNAEIGDAVPEGTAKDALRIFLILKDYIDAGAISEGGFSGAFDEAVDMAAEFGTGSARDPRTVRKELGNVRELKARIEFDLLHGTKYLKEYLERRKNRHV